MARFHLPLTRAPGGRYNFFKSSAHLFAFTDMTEILSTVAYIIIATQKTYFVLHSVGIAKIYHIFVRSDCIISYISVMKMI